VRRRRHTLRTMKNAEKTWTRRTRITVQTLPVMVYLARTWTTDIGVN
jgi:hypothetical protein